MNRLTLIGNIGKDAEVKDFNGGNSVINFNVAHTSKWTDKQGNKQEKTTWYEAAWFINNTQIAQYLKKGAKVLIEGEPTARVYNDTVYLGVNVRSLDILNFAKDDAPKQQQQAPVNNSNSGFPPPPNFNNANNDDDLPF